MTHDPAAPPVDLSVVVIGRNEGERLARCLRSVDQADLDGLRTELIYVDSGSTDGSLQTAASLGARALPLDDLAPCAAKARNLGWRSARGGLILFLDGDTELEPGFVPAARAALDAPCVCAAWGHRRESRPEQSWLTRVLDLDWIYPPGPALYFGGDVLVRRAALEQADGFDPTLPAGEEPELCARLRRLGWTIEHLDVPMTRHDLAVRTVRAWARRAYRSGIAYAEVAQRMQALGDPMWQHEARRDAWHGALYACAPLLALLAAWAWPLLLVLMGVGGAAIVLRTAWRSRWKTADPVLALAYALHVHLQKIPSAAGQWAWWRARRRQQTLGLVDYKVARSQHAPAAPPDPVGGGGRKLALARLLGPLLWLQRRLLQPAARLWAYARLRADLGGNVPPSNVVLGPVEVHGSARVRLGERALIYPGVYLETQGEGCIEIGDDVVLSRGVHIVAYERVRLGDRCLIGEYSSLRDANHRLGTDFTRQSGHDHAPIELGRNVWLGRGVTVLKGVRLGDHSVVGANAVLTHSHPAHSRLAGVPARPLEVPPSPPPAAQADRDA